MAAFVAVKQNTIKRHLRDADGECETEGGDTEVTLLVIKILPRVDTSHSTGDALYGDPEPPYSAVER